MCHKLHTAYTSVCRFTAVLNEWCQCVHRFPAEMVLICAPSLLRTALLCQRRALHGLSLSSPRFLFCPVICHRPVLPTLLSYTPVCLRELPVCVPAIRGPVNKFHTSARLHAPPAVLLWLLVKPLQKITAIILGRWDTLYKDYRHGPSIYLLSII